MSQWMKQRISYDGILAILSCAINYALGPNWVWMAEFYSASFKHGTFLSFSFVMIDLTH